MKALWWQLDQAMIYDYNNIIRNRYIDFFASHVWFYPASWFSRQCQEWAPSHGMGFKVEHSHNFFTFTLAYLVGRANCKSKVMWLGWGPNPSTGSLAWLHVVTGGYRKWPIQTPHLLMLGVLARVTLIDSWGILVALGF